MKTGGYSLDLYCDKGREAAEKAALLPGPWAFECFYYSTESGHTFREFPHQYTDTSHAKCVKRAKQDGWSISIKRDLCPRCNPRNRKA
uniref:Uncharacterized protein n=1 Tax=uncultured marine virus TaxID=186617 RepID=A0A0F7L467_9VIRU|nr:hypothetical protein [uncultured marine virus]